MTTEDRPRISIIDYRVGNMSSVRQACRHTGLDADITADSGIAASADGLILPGVGAFGDAMATLRHLNMVSVLMEAAASGKPIMGICLGIQLLMTETCEFGRHQGLGLIEGPVERLPEGLEEGRRAKVPHVGWNPVLPRDGNVAAWAGTLLEGLVAGTYMYFVHSFSAKPVKPEWVIATTRHGGYEFCSALQQGNVFACQFHPERSGRDGLKIYDNFAERVREWCRTHR